MARYCPADPFVVLAPSHIRRLLITDTPDMAALLENLIQHLAPVPVSNVADVYCKIHELMSIGDPVEALLVILIRGWTVEDVEPCITEQPKRLTPPDPDVVKRLTVAFANPGLLVIWELIILILPLLIVTAVVSDI
jgi:hypothetical protein